jgi:hypothetical protein
LLLQDGLPIWLALQLLSAGCLAFFFTIGGVFGLINDLTSVLQMIFLVPVALILNAIFYPQVPILSALTLLFGLAAMAGTALLQSLLLLRKAKFERTLLPVLGFGFVLGAWWLAIAVLSIISDLLPPGIVWLSLAAGLSSIIGVIYY